MKTWIAIDDLKCGGCANTIEKGLLSVNGVTHVNVNVDESEVLIEHAGTVNLQDVKNKLKQMGYPESGTTDSFEKLTRNVKSYISSAIGRLGPKPSEEVI
jgi:copper chaperone